MDPVERERERIIGLVVAEYRKWRDDGVENETETMTYVRMGATGACANLIAAITLPTPNPTSQEHEKRV